MKKILFMIHDLSVGGAEKVLVNLVNNLNYEKFDVTVIALFGGGVNEQFLNENVRYRAVFKRIIPGNSKMMKLFSPYCLHRWFIKEKYDIEVSYLEGPTARIVSGCPYNDTKLVSWIHSEQRTNRKAAKSFRNYKESAKSYERFHKTICVSEFVKKDFMKIYPKLSDVEVLYNVNETKCILEKSREPVENKVFRDDEVKICGVGKIVSLKGFDKLARIHKRLRDEGFPLHCYVLGVGEEQEGIVRYLKENNLTNTFTFLGYQTNPYKYVAKCDLFVCASITEGFSTATTEALIVGTPVVTTSVPGMTDMLGENNEYGVITENNEEALFQGVKNLLSNPEQLHYYKNKAKERGQFFNTENRIKAVENMLCKL